MSDKRVTNAARTAMEDSDSEREFYSDADSTKSEESDCDTCKDRSSKRKKAPPCCRCKEAPSTVGCMHSNVLGKKLEVHLCLCEDCGVAFKNEKEGVCPVEGCEALISDVATIRGLCSDSPRGSALSEDTKAKGKKRGREGSSSDSGSITGQSASTEVMESPACCLCTVATAKFACMHSQVHGKEITAHLGICSGCIDGFTVGWNGECEVNADSSTGKDICRETCSGVARIIGFEEWQIPPTAKTDA
jgi:hypothetical protein